MADLVEQLLGAPGLYVGASIDPTGEHPGGVARLTVVPLPGGAGVAIDYESLSSEAGRTHAEHAVVARDPQGLFLVTAHQHAPVAAVLRETDPGVFPGGGDQPFPMSIQIEVPESGRVVYSWSYGMPGEPLQVRDVGDLRLIP